MIWLASYPRSGNTLLRTILHHCFGIESYHDEPETRVWSDPELQTDIGFAGVWKDGPEESSGSFSGTHLVKTHGSPSDNNPAIYIVRDPRFATESYFQFLKAQSSSKYPSILEIILGAEYYGDWSDHVMRWTSRTAPTLVLHYEDLASPSATTLESIASFIGHRGSIKEWSVSFAQLHERDPVMFRKGFVSEWTRPEHWSKVDEALLIALHGNTMMRMGYAESGEIDRTIAGLDEDILNVGTLALEANRRHFKIHAGARAKEAIIRELVARTEALKPSITDSGTPAEHSRIASPVAPEGEHASSPETDGLHAQLRAKEEVIQDLVRKNREYRLALAPLGPIPGIVNRVRMRFNRVFRPGLGQLQQYPPRSLKLNYKPPKGRQPDDLPSIQIVTPSLNQGAFLEKTIESVLGQGYPNLNYHIQDGGSTDGSTTLIQSYSNQLAGWESVPDNGQADAINRGFSNAKGEIMGWINSDDLLMPHALLTVGKFFLKNPHIDVVYSHRILIDENGNEIGRWILPPHDDQVLPWADFIPQETMFWRRSIWDRSGASLDPGFQFALDWELILRFRRAGARFARINRTLGAFRVHSSQKTNVAMADTGIAEMNRLRMAELGHIPCNHEIRESIRPYINRHRRLQAWHRIRRKLGLLVP